MENVENDVGLNGKVKVVVLDGKRVLFPPNKNTTFFILFAFTIFCIRYIQLSYKRIVGKILNYFLIRVNALARVVHRIPVPVLRISLLLSFPIFFPFDLSLSLALSSFIRAVCVCSCVWCALRYCSDSIGIDNGHQSKYSTRIFGIGWFCFEFCIVVHCGCVYAISAYDLLMPKTVYFRDGRMFYWMVLHCISYNRSHMCDTCKIVAKERTTSISSILFNFYRVSLPPPHRPLSSPIALSGGSVCLSL